MRILIFNWKDIKNPEAGGAEIFTHEVAKRWVAGGDEVTMFARRLDSAPEREEIDGIHVVRRGTPLSVYREARRWYARHGPDQFDLVIDEINTRPFMAPAFVRGAHVVTLIYQLAAEAWREETPFPISTLGRYLFEPRWLRRYREVPTITISPSTQSDLRRLRFQNVTIVPVGNSIETLTEPPQKEASPTILFVGRLVRTKRPDHAISAYQILRRQLPAAQLWVIGDGYMRSRLERMAGPGVTFFGRVSERQKRELMGRAHLLAVPGVREGWGLAIVEANAMGTPAVGYRVPGLVDAIRDGQTGSIVDCAPAALAAAAADYLLAPAKLRELSGAAMSWASQFNWNRTAELMRLALEDSGLRV